MAISESDINILKINLQEKDNGTFTLEDLNALLTAHQDVWLASYFGCCIKATANADIELPGGLKVKGNSDYWMKLADAYYSKYEYNLYQANSEKQQLNTAGYKNSMGRADELPPRRGW